MPLSGLLHSVFLRMLSLIGGNLHQLGGIPNQSSLVFFELLVPMAAYLNFPYGHYYEQVVINHTLFVHTKLWFI